MKTIIMTGSVGTGKTTLAKALSEHLGYLLLDFKKFAKDKKLAIGHDKEMKCDIIDEKKFVKEIIKEITKLKKDKEVKGIIIDSHLSHYIPSKYIDTCFVTKCNIDTLSHRLKKREYDEKKIQENTECEIFDVCLEEAKKQKHKIHVINTTKGFKISQITKLTGE